MKNSSIPESKSFVPDVSGKPENQSVHRNGSWGALISITIILAMVIIGAFYSWGQRIAEQRAVQTQLQSN